MTGATLLLRQIHPSFVQDGFPTSQAFRPTPKDELELSAYDGDRITAEASFVRSTTVWKLTSVGAMTLTVDECSAETLPARPDPFDDCPEHAVIDFTGLPDKDCYKKARNFSRKHSLGAGNTR